MEAKMRIIGLFLLLAATVQSFAAAPEWENHKIFGINKEKSHATFLC